MEDRSTGRWPAGVAAHAIRRRWPVVVSCTLLTGILAALLAGTHSRTHSASATVFVRPLAGTAFTTETLANSQDTTVALNTEASLVESPAVTDRVNAALGTRLTTASAGVHAGVPTDTQLVVIKVRADSASNAVRYAGAYARAFLDYRASLARTNQRTALAQLTDQETAARKRLTEASKTVNLTHPPADAASELQLATAELASIETAIGQVSAMDTNPGSVVKPAHPGSGSWFGSPAFTVLVGLLVGAFVGFLFATWRDLRDDRLRASEASTIDDLAILRVVPHDRPDASVRDVRTGVIAAAPQGAVLAVAPVGSAEVGIAVDVGITLAHSLTAAGYRVVLADASVDRPQLAARLELTNEPGLSDALAEDGRAAAPVDVNGVRVVPAGTRVGETRERYGGAPMERVVSELRAEADYVVLVTSPAVDSDGAAVLQWVEQVLLVARDSVTRHSAVSDAAAAAGRLGCPIVGVVAVSTARGPALELNRFEMATSDRPRTADEASGDAHRPRPSGDDLPRFAQVPGDGERP